MEEGEELELPSQVQTTAPMKNAWKKCKNDFDAVPEQENAIRIRIRVCRGRGPDCRMPRLSGPFFFRAK